MSISRMNSCPSLIAPLAKYLDIHYGAIAKRAMLQEPPELNVPEAARAKFEAAFGLSWADALNQG